MIEDISDLDNINEISDPDPKPWIEIIIDDKESEGGPNEGDLPGSIPEEVKPVKDLACMEALEKAMQQLLVLEIEAMLKREKKLSFGGGS